MLRGASFNMSRYVLPLDTSSVSTELELASAGDDSSRACTVRHCCDLIAFGGDRRFLISYLLLHVHPLVDPSDGVKRLRKHDKAIVALVQVSQFRL